MLAIAQEEYGPYRDVLRVRDVPRPAVRDGDVLVRVRATSVHADVWHAVTGIPYALRVMGSGIRAPKRKVPGTDLAGEVVEVGTGVSGLAPGDRVFGEISRANQWSNAGAFAEFAAVDPARLARIPSHLSFEEAAAVPTAALIALVNLRDQGRVRPDQRVLVNGAGGAVGVWAVQLAKAFEARVTAVDAPEKLDMLRALGADQVIDYRQQDFTELEERFDIVFDVVSQLPFSRVRRVLKPDGTFVLVGHDQYGRSGHRMLGSLGRMLPLLAISPLVQQIPGIRPGPSREENWTTVVELLESRRIRPIIDEQTFPLERVVDALDYLTSGQAKGRVVITV